MTDRTTIPDFKKFINYMDIRDICEEFDDYVASYRRERDYIPINLIKKYVNFDLSNIEFDEKYDGWNGDSDWWKIKQDFKTSNDVLFGHLVNGKMLSYLSNNKDKLNVDFYEFVKALHNRLPDLE
jgi:hypothetical protein